MNTYVTAEFDSVDLADLAAGRIDDIGGVIDSKVLRNRFELEAEENDDDFNFPISSTYFGSSYTGAPPLGIFIPSYDSEGVFRDGTGNKNYEPAERRDAQLRVTVDNSKTADEVSARLRSIGGRNIQIQNK